MAEKGKTPGSRAEYLSSVMFQEIKQQYQQCLQSTVCANLTLLMLKIWTQFLLKQNLLDNEGSKVNCLKIKVMRYEKRRSKCTPFQYDDTDTSTKSYAMVFEAVYQS